MSASGFFHDKCSEMVCVFSPWEICVRLFRIVHDVGVGRVLVSFEDFLVLERRSFHVACRRHVALHSLGNRPDGNT
jgi:hypothetical protein